MRKIAVGLLLGLAALAAAAQEPGFYLGASFGSTASSACNEIMLGVSCKDGTSNLKVFAGYQVNRNVAVEAGYINTLVKSNAEAIAGNLFSPQVSSELRSRGVDFVVVPALPIGNASLYGKLGFFVAHTEQTTTRTSTATCCLRVSPVTKEERTDTGLTFGLGLEYRFGRNLAARGEWQGFRGVGGDNVREVDVGLLHVGLLYRF